MPGWLRTVAAVPGRAPRHPRWPVDLHESAVSVRGLARGPQVVRVRALHESDEAAWTRLRLAEDARLAPWEATLPPGSREVLPLFRRFVREQRRRARAGASMALVIEVDGVLAGQVSVGPVQWGSLCQASVGYWIGSAWEGRGIMTLALAMVIDHLLGPQGGLHRVEVLVRSGNARSLAVCRRLGLAEEGVRRAAMHVDGVWADHVVHARTAEDVRDGGRLVAALAAAARAERTGPGVVGASLT